MSRRLPRRRQRQILRNCLRLESLESRLPLAFDVSLSGNAVQFTGSPGNDTLTLSIAAGNLLRHNIPLGGNLVSAVDMDSVTPGAQSIAIDVISSLQVFAGAGDDTVNASTITIGMFLFGDIGNDTLQGGSGNDDIRGGNDNDTLEGNGGDDALDWYDIFQSFGNDILRGGAGNDLFLGSSTDQFFGGADIDFANTYDLTSVVLTDTTFTSGTFVSANHSIEDWDLRGSNNPDSIDASAWTLSGLNIFGNAGDDILKGGLLGDDIRGGDNNDTLEGNGGEDGLDWNDYFQSFGDDILRGGPGNDLLYGGGTDQFFGGADIDFANTYDLTSVVLTNTTFTSGTFVSANHSVEDWDLRGSNNPDSIDASAWTLSGLNIFGNAGDDILKGGLLGDDIRGGDNNDTLEGNGGEDGLDWNDYFQSFGDDILRGGPGNDLLYGGGTDQFFGGADIDFANTYDLTSVVLTNTTFTSGTFVSANHSVEDWDLRGSNNPDSIDASAWTLSGLNIFGNAGDDILKGGLLGDDIRGGDNNDTLEGNGGEDALDWNDYFQSFGDDILRGGPGNDLLYGGGTDQFFGGADIDFANTYDLTSVVLTNTTFTSGIFVSANHSVEDWDLRGSNNPDSIDASAWTLSGLNIFGNAGDDILKGGLLGDDIRGGDNNDTLEGNGGEDALDWNDYFQSFGDDILRGGPGNDLLYGGGTDQFFGGADIDFANTYDLTSVVLTNTTFTSGTFVSANHSVEDWDLRGSNNPDSIDASAWTLSGLNIFGNAGDDILKGGLLGDDIRGGDNNDTLEGNGGEDALDWNDYFQSFGDDILRGGPGNDLLYGGGTDQFFGGADIDFANTYDLTSVVLTNTTFTSGIFVSANHSIEDWDLRGSNNPDSIDASAWTLSGLNIFGNAGDDILKGGLLGDDIRGGDNNDTLEGNGGDDALDWNDFYQAFGNDILRGGPGSDLLAGFEGDDTLEGGADSDTLSGGNGSDRFVFDTDNQLGSDSINEESSVADVLDFSSTTTLGIVIDLGLPIAQVVNANLTLTLNSDSTIENVTGGALADQLIGGPIDNLLAGGPGDDTYFFDTDLAQGSDTVSEQPVGGFDTINFVRTTTLGVTFNLGLLTAQPVNANQSITLSTIGVVESVIGGFLADTLTGDDFNNTLTGGNGADTLSGAGGDDSLTGSAGDDTLIGGPDNDRYIFDADGSLGSDTLIEVSGGGIDTLNFGATTTTGVTVSLNTSAAQVVNGNLQLTLSSASAFENIVGGEQNDQLTGNSLANTLQGNGGLDTISGLAGDDLLRGNAGNDTFLFDADTPLGVDTLQDVEGGTDTLNFAATTTLGVSVDLARTAVQVVNANLQLAIAGSTQFENVIGTNLSDTLRGNSKNNVLTGGQGDDRYQFDTDSAQGTDTLVEITGGGTDTLDFSLTSNFRISLNLAVVTTQIVNSNLSLALSAVNTFENVDGGSQPDTILGNALTNRIDGRSGDDNLNGAGGNDLLIGGSGLDTLVGGPGDDTLKGGVGNDVYRFKTDTPMGSDSIEELAPDGKDRLNFDSTVSQSVVVNLGLTTAQVINPNLTLTLNAPDTMEYVTGGALDDTITGNAVNNSILGGPGNDVLLGLGGNDILQGGTGKDVLDGGAGTDRLEGNEGDDVYRFDVDTPQGSDTIQENIGGGNDLIDFGATANVGVIFDLSLSSTQVVTPGSWIRLTGDLEVEQVVGTARNDTLTGNSLNNVLIGGAGSDTLRGQSGRDLLVGGTGLDTIQGGNGEDLIIGDSLSYYSEATGQLDRPSIDAVMLEWTRTDLPYATRISNLKVGGGLNGTRRINATTVLTDAVLDQLQGDLDLDWFWQSATDLISDLNNGGVETVN